MKRCPECRRDYYDDTLLYCLDDGNALLEGPARSPSVGYEAQTAIYSSFDGTQGRPEVLSDPGQKSIAVLPFAHLSSDPDDEYFCDGLAEELLNALTRIDGLKVAARTSAFSFKGKNTNITEIARTLGVSTVLEGSVRKAGDRVRIMAQLINAADGYHLWSERYDREMKGIFDVQDEITLAVVDALKVTLIGEQKAAVLKHHTRNPDALEAYLRGLSYFTRFTPEYFRKSIESFEAAIAIDPGYAEAYAGLAESYSEMSFFTAPSRWMPMAKEAAGKSLELDEKLGKAHNSLAVIKMYYERDYAGAEVEFRRAMDLDPGSAHIQMWYGWFLGLTRRFDEGMTRMKNARELDPLSPLIAFGIGAICLWSKRCDQAIGHLKGVVELNPEFRLGHQYLAAAYLTNGDVSSALATTENAPFSLDDPFSMTSAAYVYAKAGDRVRALEILGKVERLSADEFELAVQIAQIYVGLNDKEKAFAWLEKASDEHSVWPIWLGVDPTFDPLRSDPRFSDLLKRMGLPE